MKVSRGVGRAVGWLVAAWLAVAGLAAGAAEGSPGGAGLTDFQGKPLPLEDLLGQGRWTVVMFWASDCRVCAQEAPAWVLFDERQRKKDARVIGVSLDGKARLEAARAFRDRHLMDFPNLIGEPEDVARLFTDRARQPWLGTPSFLVYAPTGELKARHIGALPPERLEEYIRKQSSK